MAEITERLSKRSAWKALAAHYKEARELHLRELFSDDSKRAEHMTAEAAGLLLDYSKNRVTKETIGLLLQLGGCRTYPTPILGTDFW